jgi:hypothetical protein
VRAERVNTSAFPELNVHSTMLEPGFNYFWPRLRVTWKPSTKTTVYSIVIRSSLHRRVQMQAGTCNKAPSQHVASGLWSLEAGSADVIVG